MSKPHVRPSNPQFSTGPCTKHPGWSLHALAGAEIGRSHRAKQPKAKLAEVINMTTQTKNLDIKTPSKTNDNNDSIVCNCRPVARLNLRGHDSSLKLA